MKNIKPTTMIRNNKTIITITFLTILLFWTTLPAFSRTMVIPFKVTPAEDTAHQWLGRATSYYITRGLQMNHIDVLTDHTTTSILETNHIYFPYNVTKASILQLARQYNTDTIIWGEIFTQNNNQPGIQVKAFIIDIKNLSQKYLPLLKGNLENLYQIKAELLIDITKTTDPNLSPLTPAFDFNHRTFEIFIKSLLLKDKSKKEQQLEMAIRSCGDKGSPFLDLELAKVLVANNNCPTAKKQLEKIQPSSLEPISKQELEFLTGIIEYKEGNKSAAIQIFMNFTNESPFQFAANHNLGILYAENKKWNLALPFFQTALDTETNPETWLNLVQALLNNNDTEKAINSLIRALKQYPGNENLRDWFSLIISQSEDRETLTTVFNNYIPDLFNSDKEPVILLELKNPFDAHIYLSPGPSLASTDTEQNINNNDIDASIEQLQEMLSINPFIADYYRQLSQLFLDRKDFYRAEHHAQAALFLEKNQDNRLQLAKIYRLLGKKSQADSLEKN